jgi:ketosteroid isomerase-like protein
LRKTRDEKDSETKLTRTRKLPDVSIRSEEARLEQLVRELVETWSSTWTSKDTTAASKFYSKAPDLVFFDIGPIHVGWGQYRKNIEKSFEEIESLSLTLNEDLRVTVHGSMALTTATGRVSSKSKDDKSFDSNIRFTGVWEKKGRLWHLVHDHWSRSRV